MRGRLQLQHSVGFAVLIEMVLIGAVIWSAFMLPGCATLSTADQAGVALCKLWQATNPPPSTADNVAQVSCDVIEVTAPWVQAAQLAAAKPNAQAAVDALVAHPPLSSAAALALPCLAPPPQPGDDLNPYRGPQSRLERRLYPVIVVPEHGLE